MELKIYTCAEWGAEAPRRPILVTGRPMRIIDHHTAGHAPNLDHKPSETLEEAKAYARGLQRDHIGRGWSDTGQNFLVSRSGHVLEGRHGSVSAIAAGKMVISAHCPGQNDQPGIEHEHFGTEALTRPQKKASIALHAWICRKTGIRPTEFYPHGDFNRTDCPSATVRDWIPELKTAVIRELNENGSPPARKASPSRRSGRRSTGA
jgi:hypothetical protein